MFTRDVSPASGGRGWRKAPSEYKPHTMKADNSNYHGYNKRLQPFAHDLRFNMTKAEVHLWKYVLKAGLMRGYTFRRQRPVLNYIADFMCMPLMLIIEVDGSIDEIEEIKIRDQKREKELTAAG